MSGSTSRSASTSSRAPGRLAWRRPVLALALTAFAAGAAWPAQAEGVSSPPPVLPAAPSDHSHGASTPEHEHAPAMPSAARTDADDLPSRDDFRAVPYTPVVAAGFAAAPAALSSDLSVRGIELTQAIQCFDRNRGLTGCTDNSLTLATGKASAARVYLRSTPFRQGSVPVRFSYRLAGQPWSSVLLSGPATPTLSRAAADSLNVYFTQVGSSATGEFYVEVDPDDVIAESDETNNRFPASGVTTVRFERTRDVPVVGRRLDYQLDGYTGTRKAGGWAVDGGGTQWWNRLLPVREGGVTNRVAPGYLTWRAEVDSGDGQHVLIRRLNLHWLLAQFPFLGGSSALRGARHVYGWVPSDAGIGGHADMPVYPHAGGFGVVGLGTDTPGTSTDDPGRGATILGHELTHDYDVKHTATADSCGSLDSSSDWPYTDSGIQEFGFNTATGVVYDPAESHDLMSYCPPGTRKGWISPFTWQQMHDALRLAPVSAAGQPDAAEEDLPALPDERTPPTTGEDGVPAEWLLVDATLTRSGEGRLGTLYGLPDGRELGTDGRGRHVLQLLDGEGEVLDEHRFAVTFDSEYHHSRSAAAPGADEMRFRDGPREASALLSVPMRGAQAVALGVADADGSVRELDRREVSASAPQVLSVEPDSLRWEPGSRHEVRWTSTDADGDALTHLLHGSRDGGASWDLLAGPTQETSAELDTDGLAGGDLLLRVVSSDGVRVGARTADAAVAVPDQLPLARVVQPAPGRTVAQGALLVLEGTATDLEDGALEGDALRWSVDGADVGRGASVLLTDLAPGSHEVVLTAVDSAGGTSTDSTEVVVTSVEARDGAPVLEGDPVSSRAVVHAPAGALTCRVSYGDGTEEEEGTAADGSCTGPVHRYADDGRYTVTSTVLSGDVLVGVDTATQVVGNAVPVLADEGERLVQAGTGLSLALPFTDAGVADLHTATVDWGDGTSGPAAVEQRPGGGTVRAEHTWTTPGVRTVTVTVTDDDGASASRALDVAVVDRGPGRVTGGARFGPSGAEQLTAEVRYAKSAALPSGQTRYVRDGRRFTATGFDWLVVDGERATWSARGTLDGEPGHRLLVALVDRGRSDRLRVRLTGPDGTVLVDTQPGAPASAAPILPVDGGNLTVHR